MRIFRSDGEFATPILSFAISTIELVSNNGTTEHEFLRQDLQACVPLFNTTPTVLAQFSRSTFSLPAFRCRSTAGYLFRLSLAADVISANDGPFSDPLMTERLRDSVLTIFALYACDSVSRSTEVTNPLSRSVRCICSMTYLARRAPIELAWFEPLSIVIVPSSLDLRTPLIRTRRPLQLTAPT